MVSQRVVLALSKYQWFTWQWNVFYVLCSVLMYHVQSFLGIQCFAAALFSWNFGCSGDVKEKWGVRKLTGPSFSLQQAVLSAATSPRWSWQFNTEPAASEYKRKLWELTDLFQSFFVEFAWGCTFSLLDTWMSKNADLWTPWTASHDSQVRRQAIILWYARCCIVFTCPYL